MIGRCDVLHLMIVHMKIVYDGTTCRHVYRRAE